MSETESQPSFKYWAFVSYSHYDMRVAKWLTAALAKKSVPAKFRSLIEGAPATFAPIFRDEVEVSAASRLDDSIQAALRQSRSLIVVCSPFAVASDYVAQEIQYFISLGRADRILCVVASGEPNAADQGRPAIECFPKPLRFRVAADGTQTDEPVPAASRPLAANLGEETSAEQERALRQVMSGLLGINQSELDQHAERKVLLRRLAMGGAAIATLGTAFLLWDAFYREHTAYYSGAVRRWGVWEGLGELSSSEARRSGASYKFTTRGWNDKPHQLAMVNGHGRCPASALESVAGETATTRCSSYMAKFGMDSASRRACTIRLKYNADGTPASEETLDEFGNLLETLQFTGPNVATFVEAQFPCENGRGKSGIAFVEFERIKDGAAAGLDRAIRFLGKDRKARPNEAGIYGLRLEYDESGWRKSFTNLGPDGKAPWPDKYNIEVYRYSRDDKGNATRVEYLTLGGGFAKSTFGVGGRLSEYDASGNELKRMFLSAKNKPGGTDLALRSSGSAGWVSTYDERGNETETIYVGLQGSPVITSSGKSGATEEFDEHGNSIRLMNFGVDPKSPQTRFPVLAKEGNAGWTSRYDVLGREIERVYVGLDGVTPVRRSEGYAGWRATYDRAGNRLSNVWIDEKGNPTPEAGGGYGWRYTFDDNGNAIASVVLDANGDPMPTKANVAQVVAEHDASTKKLKISFLDKDGKPTLRSDYTAGYWLASNEEGDTPERTYFGLDEHGQPNNGTYQKDGCAKIVSTFNVRGWETRHACLGTTGLPAFNKEGYASWTAEYDAQGRVTRKLFFGDDGAPVQVNEGYAGVRSTYDDLGREVETMNLGPDGKHPILNKNGIARTVRTFDRVGNTIEAQFYDAADLKRRAVNVDKAAGWRAKYDLRGYLVEQTWCDANRDPVRITSGFATVRYGYDARGNRTSISYWGVSGNDRAVNSASSYSYAQFTFDARGNQLMAHYYEQNGDRRGERAAYDARDNKTALDILDGNDRPIVVARLGYAGTRSSFDGRGNEISMTYVDQHGHPIRAANGIVGWNAKFDLRGLRTERVFVDERGLPETRPDGIGILRAEYDARGNRSRNVVLDKDGTLIKSGRAFEKDPVSGWTSRYDARDRLIEETILGPDDKPTAIAGRCTTVRISYDARGNVAARECLGLSGEAVNDAKGISSEHFEYDEHDQKIKAEYVNARGAKVTPKAGR